MKSTGPAHNWGHAVAYHPNLCRMLGSVNASILLQQIRYWCDRTDNPLGVYKTAEELTKETGLSYREQATARKLLTESGYLVETNKRLEHRIYYRIEWPTFNAAFECWAIENDPSASADFVDPEMRKAQSGSNSKRSSSIDTETTSETTQRAGKPAPPRARKVREEKTMAEWLESLPDTEDAISQDDPIFTRGIPSDMIETAWNVFRDRYTTDDNNKTKRYKDWRQTFRNAIDNNWLKLWWIDGSGAYQLTTAGKQAAARFGETR